MKYRKYKKQVRKNIVTQINKLRPNSDEIVTICYPYGEVNLKALQDFYSYVCKIFKHNKILMIPESMSIDACTKEEIQYVIDMLQSAINNK